MLGLVPVGGAAEGEWADHPDRPPRIIVRAKGRGGGEKRHAGGSQAYNARRVSIEVSRNQLNRKGLRSWLRPVA
jgi:hypothetical protein